MVRRVTASDMVAMPVALSMVVLCHGTHRRLPTSASVLEITLIALSPCAMAE